MLDLFDYGKTNHVKKEWFLSSAFGGNNPCFVLLVIYKLVKLVSVSQIMSDHDFKKMYRLEPYKDLSVSRNVLF